MLKDNGERIEEDTKIKSVAFSDFKRIKIIDKNMTSIQRTIILQCIKDSNKKYGRKLNKIERRALINKIKEKIKRPLNEEDFNLLNERLLKE